MDTGTLARRARASLGYAAAGLFVAAAAIAVGLLVTPQQQVTVAGQEIGVGAAAPSLSLSGPGEVNLFGQGLPTTLQFAGPVRPLLTLTHITLNEQLASTFRPGHGRTIPGQVQAIGQDLAAGWTRYFAWETAVTGGCALLLTGAIAGWARFPRRRTLLLIGAGLVLAEVINVGGIMVTAYTAPARLRGVASLTALAGQSRLPAVPDVAGPPRARVQAVVMGDSTAAGLGNAPLPHPARLDRACHRSAEAYAADLAAVNDWDVLNLACSGATIRAGILGAQHMRHTTAPPQLAQARKATHASVVIVSIGANDLGWSGLVRLCAAAPDCGDKATTAYFQQRLATFTSHYYQLLQQLATLPSHPRVLINLYYDPFDLQSTCLDAEHLGPAKQEALLGLLHALNSVLANGAKAASEIPVRPDFTGHALCDPGSYVQGVTASAPFHPTAAGQLAIALADEQALQQAESTPGTSPGSGSPGTSPGSGSPGPSSPGAGSPGARSPGARSPGAGSPGRPASARARPAPR